MKTQEEFRVESISFTADQEKRVALANVRIGSTLVRGIAIWRSGNGQLRVYLPSYRLGRIFDDAVQLPDDLRTDVEAAVITAFKEAKAEAEKCPKST
jgi:hypothetical protein